jgi:hypothetical protein
MLETLFATLPVLHFEYSFPNFCAIESNIADEVLGNSTGSIGGFFILNEGVGDIIGFFLEDTGTYWS